MLVSLKKCWNNGEAEKNNANIFKVKNITLYWDCLESFISFNGDHAPLVYQYRVGEIDSSICKFDCTAMLPLFINTGWEDQVWSPNVALSVLQHCGSSGWYVHQNMRMQPGCKKCNNRNGPEFEFILPTPFFLSEINQFAVDNLHEFMSGPGQHKDLPQYSHSNTYRISRKTQILPRKIIKNSYGNKINCQSNKCTYP